MNRKTVLRTIIGLAISGVAIWILARSVDVARTFDVLRTANPLWILVMVGTVFLDVGARGGRWQGLLDPIKHLPYRRVLGYTYLGYLANNVLPARLGELVRAHALGEGEGISRATVLGTVVVERIVDTVIVVGLAALAVLMLDVGGAMSTAVILGAGFVGLLVVGLFVAMVSHRLPGADRVTAVAERYPRILELARRLREGLAVVSRPEHAGPSPDPQRGRVDGVDSPRSSPADRQSASSSRSPRPRCCPAGSPSRRSCPRRRAMSGRSSSRRCRSRRSSSGSRRGVRDGPAGPRHDPRRDVGRWRHRRAAAGRGARYRDR